MRVNIELAQDGQGLDNRTAALLLQELLGHM